MIPSRLKFGTRVGRRVVGLFIVCALLPVALTIGVSYDRIQSALVRERLGQLGQTAEATGTAILDRLHLGEQVMRSVTSSPDPARVAGQVLREHFSAAYVVAPGSPVVALIGHVAPPADVVAAAADSRLEDGRTLVRTSTASNGRAGVWLLRALSGQGIRSGTFVAELNPRFLWGTEDELPFSTDLCVLDSARVPLHCTRPLPPSAREEISALLARGPAGQLTWDEGSERRIGSVRELFLEGQYGAASWPIMVSQPEEYALAATREVRRVVVPVVALGLMIAALLGLIQVRRTLDPLHRLTEATRRIAARDFDNARVAETGADEFGDLAKAFNTMSERLGLQFQALGALAQIDSVILSKVDLQRIVEIVLGRIREVVAAEWHMLIVESNSAPGTFVVHAPSGPDGWNGRTLALDPEAARRLAALTQGITLSSNGVVPSMLAPLIPAVARSAFVLPVAVEGRLSGALVLAGRDELALPQDGLRLVRDLADRMAVALATAARDRELHRRANFDPLTRLPNRTLFMDELARELARAERQGHQLAVLFIDLDGFKAVNDSLGHAAGDELLVRAAERLHSCVRKSDLIARLGGDEFTIALPDLRDAGLASTVAQHVITALSEPYSIGRVETFVAASVGIATFPIDGVTAEELLRHADMAMYRAKQRGRGNHAFFEESMNRDAQRRMALDRDLRQALENGEFVLHYQPQLDLRTNRVVGAEALIRWLHPQQGLIAPAPFINFAEETGLIEPIGEWALREACAQFLAWQREGLSIDHVSVNVSPRQFRRKDFPDLVARVLESSGMDPTALRLEITESVLVDDSGAADATLASLNRLGTPLELDDFGTGYSSLAYLQRLPVATIKLDRSFVKDIPANVNGQAIVRAAIAMVHAMKKQVVAEGVETREQVELLRSWGCDAIQGYYLSKPVPAEAFAALVERAEPAGVLSTG